MSIIRKASESDLKEIMKIERESFSAEIQETELSFRERMQIFPDGFFVLENDGVLIGYMCSELWDSVPEKGDSCFMLNHSAVKSHKNNGSVLYISSIAVLQKVWGSGFGQKLFFEGLKEITEAVPRITDAVLIVNEIWTGAIHVYKKNGFWEYGRIQSFFPGNPMGTDGILMRRQIRRKI